LDNPPKPPSGSYVIGRLRGVSFKYEKTFKSSNKTLKGDVNSYSNLRDEDVNNLGNDVDLFEDADNF